MHQQAVKSIIKKPADAIEAGQAFYIRSYLFLH
jgi:hypothetical protein